jgi:flavin reductase (DIM6/NTAB) family NADH-FMN oxidoreductase RutF
MVSTIVPRPIAWVTTRNQDESINLAPYSFFNGVTSKPPVLMFSIARKPDGSKKDTLCNIETRQEFVVNTVPSSSFESMVSSGAALNYGDSEVSRLNLSLLESQYIKTPRLAESKVQFECELLRLVDIGEGSEVSASVVFGRIIAIHIADGLLDEKQRMQYNLLDPLGRLGGISYCRLGEELHKAIPDPDAL